MVKCKRGFMKMKPNASWVLAVEMFKNKVEDQGARVVRIINAWPVGDDVFGIIANVDYEEYGNAD